VNTLDHDRAKEFSCIYEGLYRRVHAYAARRVGWDAADEVTAETFLVAWRRFDVVPSEPLPWLYGVARHVVLQHLAACNRREAMRQALEFDRPVRVAPQEADDSPLWAAWHQLRESDREVLALIAWEELSVRDAALVVGCSAPVFSVRLHRARKRLEQLLECRIVTSNHTTHLTETS
jgi:RNA polymerase sigma-70 factor (ECF subfamily)